MTLYVIATALSFLALGVLAIATSQPRPRYDKPARSDWWASIAEPIGRHRATVVIGA